MCNNCNTLKLTHEELQAIASALEFMYYQPDCELNNAELDVMHKIERYLKKHAARLDTNPASA